MLDSKLQRRLCKIHHRSEGASQEQLMRLQTNLGVTLPTDLLDVLRFSNGLEGGLEPKGWLALWSTEHMPVHNLGYEPQVTAPGLVLIGSDGCGTAFGLDT